MSEDHGSLGGMYNLSKGGKARYSMESDKFSHSYWHGWLGAVYEGDLVRSGKGYTAFKRTVAGPQ